MARTFDIKCEPDRLEAFRDTLRRTIQSCQLSFLFGSGASLPAIPVAGPIEKELGDLERQGKRAEANRRLLDLVGTLREPTEKLLDGPIDGAIAETIENYAAFLRSMDALLEARRSTLLPKQATVFSTNYDLFIEKASERVGTVIVNDGFDRSPVLSGAYPFRPERFFDSTLHAGHPYGYTAEIPTINLLKVHGSLAWRKNGAEISYGLFDFANLPSASDGHLHDEFLAGLNIVVPGVAKFAQTTLERTYYDLLRIFSNQLETRNSLMFTFGFSFADEHLQHILTRALRNPTLQLFACCYTKQDIDAVNSKFSNFNNVTALHAGDQGLDFKAFTNLLSSLAPSMVSA